MIHPNCSTCTYSHATTVTDSQCNKSITARECRRFPPNGMSRFPRVSAVDWCGEHSELKAAPVYTFDPTKISTKELEQLQKGKGKRHEQAR